MIVPAGMPAPLTLWPRLSPSVLTRVRILEAIAGALVTPEFAFSPASCARNAPWVIVVTPL